MTNFDCINVVQYFIIKASERSIITALEMTNLKVQKLLFYAQSIHLALCDRPLFQDRIEAWRSGPVCPPAYQFYSDFEAKQLPIPDRKCLASISLDIKNLLGQVWQYWGLLHNYQLSAMTREEKAWQKARNGLAPEASSNNQILLEDLKDLGHQKIKEILDTEENNRELIILLFANEKLTLGQASKLAKMSQFQFQQLLTSRKIPLHYDIAELEADVKTLKKMGRL